ncbi:hypothetical protein V3481_007222 [Fusarium oxysporum f. sp. vasinfectum]
MFAPGLWMRTRLNYTTIYIKKLKLFRTPFSTMADMVEVVLASTCHPVPLRLRLHDHKYTSHPVRSFSYTNRQKCHCPSAIRSLSTSRLWLSPTMRQRMTQGLGRRSPPLLPSTRNPSKYRLCMTHSFVLYNHYTVHTRTPVACCPSNTAPPLFSSRKVARACPPPRVG